MTDILYTLNHPNAKAPSQGTAGAAAMDVYSAEVVRTDRGTYEVDTGLRTAFDPGQALFLFNRSGLACKNGVSLCNSVAVIDSDYRGNIKLVFESQVDDDKTMELLAPGNRVAQAILVKLPHTFWSQVDCLPPSQRGEGGFGSTGA